MIYAHAHNWTSSFWLIYYIAFTRLFTGEMFTSCNKSESPNPFSVTNLRPEVESVHLLRMRTHYRHKKSQKTVSCLIASLQENGCTECKYIIMHFPQAQTIRQILLLTTTSDLKSDVIYEFSAPVFLQRRGHFRARHHFWWLLWR